MTVILLTNDLMFSSHLAGAAQRAGVVLRVIDTVDQCAENAGQQGVWSIIVDLSVPGLQAGEVIRQLRNASSPPRAIVAYAPHVHEEKLAAAKDAGCDVVLTRGQMHSRAEALLRELCSPGERGT